MGEQVTAATYRAGARYDITGGKYKGERSAVGQPGLGSSRECALRLADGSLVLVRFTSMVHAA